MNYDKHIRMLRTIAEDNEPVSKARIAAMVLHKGVPISFGFNQLKTHPFAARYSRNPEAIFLHAETDAIQKASRRMSPIALAKATLIVCRIKSDEDGNLIFGLAKPCSGCAACIKAFGLKRVIYTLNSETLKYDEFNG